jgi:dihydroflavonol-4-reductase
LMESDISGERFILNSQNIPYQDLFTMIAKNIKKPAPKILASSWMLNLMWRFDSIKSSVLGIDSKFSKELIRSFETKFDYENNKIVKDLGYEFIPTEQTISQTAIQYLESKKNNSIFAILKD